MSLPYDDQPSRLPLPHIVRRALTLPSGRLKAGVSAQEYRIVMDRANAVERQYPNMRRTHASLAFLEADVLAIVRLLSDPSEAADPDGWRR